ncbi:MAG TPA: tetratricopeptide repeat protein [Chloroflexia bacterium]|nr:tetratricopeptide repeat protein [Chloroflexia bacterium]
MPDLGRLLKPAAIARIALIYLVVMGLYASGVHAERDGAGSWLQVTLGMSALMTVATVAVIFALTVAGRGGIGAWQAGRLGAAGQSKDSLARYNAVLTRHPNRAEALVGRAEVLAATGNIAAALADLDHAIAITPHVSNFPEPVLYRAYRERGRLRDAAGDVAGALADWTQALRAGPGAPDIYVLRGRAALQMGDWVAGRTSLATGVEMLSRNLARASDDKQRASILDTRGLAYSLLGNHQRALADLEQALKLQPGAWLTHYNLGATYANLGHMAQALAALRQAITLHPAARDLARKSQSYAPLRDTLEFGSLVGEP